MSALSIILLILIVLAILTPFHGATDLHFHKAPKQGTIRVACVGDSITNGALIFGCFFRSYPARLQKMLGRKYHVENYGLNDRTVQSNADKPYEREAEFERSLAFRPEIVIILLGTNDTKSHNWVSQEQFGKEYRRLLQNYRDLDSVKMIILCTPPWQRNAGNFVEHLTNDTSAERTPQVAEEVRRIGEEYGLPVIDLYREFCKREDLLCYDGVHPNNKGDDVIADRICREMLIFQDCR